MKDGEERRVPAQIIYMYQTEDRSAGLPAGLFIAGLEVNGDFIELEDIRVKKNYGSGEKEWDTLVVDPQDAEKLWKIADELSQEGVSEPPASDGE